MCGTDPTAPETTSRVSIREESQSYCGAMPQGDRLAKDVARIVRAMKVLAARLCVAPVPRLSVPGARDPHMEFLLKALGRLLARNTTSPRNWTTLAVRAQGAGAHFEDASRLFFRAAKAARRGSTETRAKR